jgi:hypothetical protein
MGRKNVSSRLLSFVSDLVHTLVDLFLVTDSRFILGNVVDFCLLLSDINLLFSFTIYLVAIHLLTSSSVLSHVFVVHFFGHFLA